jgi:hypothetical protein
VICGGLAIGEVDRGLKTPCTWVAERLERSI